jgi:hypothetical protein
VLVKIGARIVPRPLRRVPTCGGGGDPSAVRGHPSRDRPPPAKAAPRMSWLLRAPPPRASGCWKTAAAGAAAWPRASRCRCTGMAQGGRESTSSCPRQRPCSNRQRRFGGSEPAFSLVLRRRGYSARLAWTPRWRARHLRGWAELLATACSRRQAHEFRRGSAWQPLRFAAIGTQSGPRLKR